MQDRDARVLAACSALEETAAILCHCSAALYRLVSHASLLYTTVRIIWCNDQF